MKYSSYLPILGSFLIVGCSSSPQVLHWKFTGGPTAQNISTVFVDGHDKSHLIAGLTTGETFTSFDRGRSWSKLSTLAANVAIYRFVQHPDNPKQIFAITNHGLFESGNMGETWSKVIVDSPFVDVPTHALVIEQYNTNTMYVGFKDQGIYKSTDAGNTWTPKILGLDSSAMPNSIVNDIEIDPLRPDEVYAAIKGIGVVRSTDGGSSWTKLTSVIGSFGIAPTCIVLSSKTTGVICFGMDGGSIYRSVDGGASWSPSRFGTGSSKPVDILVDPSNPDILYAGTENDVLMSLDFGATWRSIGSGLPRVATSIAVAPGGPSPTLYAFGEGLGLNMTLDNGKTWSRLGSNLGGSSVTTMQLSEQGFDLYAVVGASVHHWNSLTGRWKSASNGLTGGTISSIAIETDSSSVVYASTSVGIFTTVDGGASWFVGSPQMRGKPITLLSAHPAFPTRLLANTQNELFVSTNRGTTWNIAKPLSEKRSVRSFTFSRTDAGFVLGATAKNGVVLSSNGGLSWETNRYGLESASLVAVTLDDKDRQTLYAWSDDGMGFRTTDKGIVWSRYSPPWQQGESVRIVFDRYNPSEVVAIRGSREMYYSRSGGATWFSVPADSIPGDLNSACWNSKTTTLYAGVNNLGVYQLSLGEYLKQRLEE